MTQLFCVCVFGREHLTICTLQPINFAISENGQQYCLKSSHMITCAQTFHGNPPAHIQNTRNVKRWQGDILKVYLSSPEFCVHNRLMCFM